MFKLIGWNYKSTSLESRERLSALPTKAFYEQARELGFAECVIISTCNRIEIVSTSDFEPLLEALHITEFKKESYAYIKDDVIRHLLNVACGLDSMVLGEPQILGQLKQAFAEASKEKFVGNYLGHLFPFIFSTAKKVRFSTAIGVNSTSVAHTSMVLIKKNFPSLVNIKVLFVGAGDMIRLCTEYLSKLNPREMIIANRTLQKGEMLAKKYGGKAITIAAIPDYLPLVDIVISCTASQLPMIGKGLVERIMRQRSRPLMFVDLGMPRDIEPEVSQLPQITLFNIDDIQHVVESHLEQRKEACHYALHIIEEELQGFLAWQNMRKAAVPMIVAYRSHMESVRDKEIQKALQGLKNGKSAEEMIKKLGKDLTQRLIHTPTLEMRQMAAQGKTDMLEFVKELLKINV